MTSVTYYIVLCTNAVACMLSKMKQLVIHKQFWPSALEWIYIPLFFLSSHSIHHTMKHIWKGIMVICVDVSVHNICGKLQMLAAQMSYWHT